MKKRVQKLINEGKNEENALVFDGMGYAFKYKGMPLRSKQHKCFVRNYSKRQK